MGLCQAHVSAYIMLMQWDGVNVGLGLGRSLSVIHGTLNYALGTVIQHSKRRCGRLECAILNHQCSQKLNSSTK